MEKEGETMEMRGKERKVVAEVNKSSLAAVLVHCHILSIFCTDLDPKYSYQLTTFLILRGGS